MTPALLVAKRSHRSLGYIVACAGRIRIRHDRVRLERRGVDLQETR
jgi:hypothetical protein